jgi:chromosome segregation ATPase
MKGNASAVAADPLERELTPRELQAQLSEAYAAAVDKAGGLKARRANLQAELERIGTDRATLIRKLANGDSGCVGAIDSLERRTAEMQRQAEGIGVLLTDAEEEGSRLSAQLQEASKVAQITDVKAQLEETRTAAKRAIPKMRAEVGALSEDFAKFTDYLDELDRLVEQLEAKGTYSEYRQELMNELGLPYASSITRYLIVSGWQPKIGAGWGANNNWQLSITPLYPPSSGRGDAE